MPVERLDRDWTLRKAHITDIPRIHELVNSFAARGEMLGRSRSELYEGLRDFFVMELDGSVQGCCALHVNWEDLAVHEDFQGKGIGGALVLACIEEARHLGVGRVYALTYRAGFFEKLGFRHVSKEILPQKVWGDCLKCPRFPNCDEDALVMDVA
jgi:amino-acid N-acetyltransferase